MKKRKAGEANKVLSLDIRSFEAHPMDRQLESLLVLISTQVQLKVVVAAESNILVAPSVLCAFVR